jgi:putative FmdB family regulatory protein
MTLNSSVKVETMPNYEYRCNDCKRRFSLFMTYAEYDDKKIICSHCGSENVIRLIGRIRIAKSEESRLENIADPAALESLEDDPVALGRMMRRMSGELGEEMPPEFGEVVDRLESGQSPDEIERDLPELADDPGTAAGFGGGIEDDF